MPNRRQFLAQIAGLLCSGSGMAGTITGQACSKDPITLFEPASPMHWLGDGFVWTGVLNRNGQREHALIFHRPGQPVMRLAPLGDHRLCRPGIEPNFFAFGTGNEGTIALRGPNGQVTPLADSGMALDNCHFVAARERERLEKAGLTGLTATTVDAHIDATRPQRTLACRPAEAGKTEIFLVDSVPRYLKIDWPLATDNPVLAIDHSTGGWLAYPSLTFDRRQELKGILPGIPVGRIGKNFALEMTWVHWSEWNLSGPYRITPVSANRLAYTTSLGWTDRGEQVSGIYLQEGGGWSRRFAGNIDYASLAASADGRFLAWREQFLAGLLSDIYGKVRYVSRMEPV